MLDAALTELRADTADAVVDGLAGWAEQALSAWVDALNRLADAADAAGDRSDADRLVRRR